METNRKDEFDKFMKALENAGILKGWTEFMEQKESKGSNS